MTKLQKLVLRVSILASMVAAIDGFIVNVALPAINKDLGGGLAVQQWTVDAYLLTLGALILVAGSLSDLLGRKRILWSVGWFLLSASRTVRKPYESADCQQKCCKSAYANVYSGQSD